MPLTTDSLFCLGVVFILESDRFKAPIHGKGAPLMNDHHLGGADYKHKALYKNANIKAYILKGQQPLFCIHIHLRHTQPYTAIGKQIMWKVKVLAEAIIHTE